tara:strand:- start:328 stop:486 length:159 start_codon:yes stop_codon:yes gene_type:complete
MFSRNSIALAIYGPPFKGFGRHHDVHSEAVAQAAGKQANSGIAPFFSAPKRG